MFGQVTVLASLLCGYSVLSARFLFFISIIHSEYENRTDYWFLAANYSRTHLQLHNHLLRFTTAIFLITANNIIINSDWNSDPVSWKITVDRYQVFTSV